MNTQAEKMVGDNTILLHLQCFKYVLVFITVQKQALVHSCQITKLICSRFYNLFALPGLGFADETLKFC